MWLVSCAAWHHRPRSLRDRCWATGMLRLMGSELVVVSAAELESLEIAANRC